MSPFTFRCCFGLYFIFPATSIDRTVVFLTIPVKHHCAAEIFQEHTVTLRDKPRLLQVVPLFL